MYQETTTFTRRSTYCENLQNMDASFLSYGEGANYSKNEDNTHNTTKYFYNKVIDKNDPDLSGSFQPGTYNSVFFSDNSDTVYDNDGIEKDIKYFNNVSHILADYYSKNMITDEISE